MEEGSFLKSLSKHKIIGIDTSPFIYHFEKDPTFSGLTLKLFDEVEKGNLKAVTSVLTLMEVLVRPKRLNHQRAIEDYKFALKTFPNLSLKAIDDICAERAADLRAAYEIRPPDALQIGVAILSNATGFVTNDEKLRKVREVEVMILKDFVGHNP